MLFQILELTSGLDITLFTHSCLHLTAYNYTDGYLFHFVVCWITPPCLPLFWRDMYVHLEDKGMQFNPTRTS
jgi:hypothetical protein